MVYKGHKAEGRKTDNYVIPTPEFLKIKDEIMAQAEMFSPIAYPMLIEPNDWTNERHGGYLLNEIRKCHDWCVTVTATLYRGKHR